MAIYHTPTKSKKRKTNQSKKFLQAKADHQKFLDSVGIRVSKKRPNNPDNFPDLTVPVRGAILSNSIPGNGFKRSIDDYRWRKGHEESRLAIEEAERKKSRVAPAYNKGPVMYVTESDDPASLGKKI